MCGPWLLKMARGSALGQGMGHGFQHGRLAWRRRHWVEQMGRLKGGEGLCEETRRDRETRRDLLWGLVGDPQVDRETRRRCG
jgi:hypothetical protein